MAWPGGVTGVAADFGTGPGGLSTYQDLWGSGGGSSGGGGGSGIPPEQRARAIAAEGMMDVELDVSIRTHNLPEGWPKTIAEKINIINMAKRYPADHWSAWTGQKLEFWSWEIDRLTNYLFTGDRSLVNQQARALIEAAGWLGVGGFVISKIARDALGRVGREYIGRL
jgi:hypothetical protein